MAHEIDTEMTAWLLSAHKFMKTKKKVPLDDPFGDKTTNILDVLEGALDDVEVWESEKPKGAPPRWRPNRVEINGVWRHTTEPTVLLGEVLVAKPATRQEIEDGDGELLQIQEGWYRRTRLFFAVVAPAGSKYAMLITEQRGGFVIWAEFLDKVVIEAVRGAFAPADQDKRRTVEHGPMTTDDLAQVIAKAQGRLKQLTGRRTIKTSTVSVDGEPVETTLSSIADEVRTLRPRQHLSSDELAAAFQEKNPRGLLMLVLPGQEDLVDEQLLGNDLVWSATVQIGDAQRTVRISNPLYKLIPWPVRVLEGSDGYPTRAGLAAEAMLLASEWGKHLGFGG